MVRRCSEGTVRPRLGERRAFGVAALGFLALELREPELRLLHRCFDTWRGAGQWIAVFYAGQGGAQPLEAAGTAQAPMPWVACSGPPRQHLVARPIADGFGAVTCCVKCWPRRTAESVELLVTGVDDVMGERQCSST